MEPLGRLTYCGSGPRTLGHRQARRATTGQHTAIVLGSSRISELRRVEVVTKMLHVIYLSCISGPCRALALALQRLLLPDHLLLVTSQEHWRSHVIAKPPQCNGAGFAVSHLCFSFGVGFCRERLGVLSQWFGPFWLILLTSVACFFLADLLAYCWT